MEKVNKRIKYVGFYDLQNSKVKRNISLAAVNKMDYIIDVLNRLDYRVDIISLAYSIEKNNKYNSSKKIEINSNNLILFPSLGVNYKLFNYLNIFIVNLYLFFWLMKYTKKGEKILVYHSLYLTIPILLLKYFKKIDIILELEEIYSDITHKSQLFKITESLIIRKSSKFILASETLKSTISKEKESIVLYGVYTPILKQEIKNDKIEILYAGIIDRNKQGAFNALKSTVYLNENYRLSIIGFGDIDFLKKEINKIKKTTKCEINYDGLLLGKEFIEYCQKKDIGLSTQITEGSYNNTSFPSKILTYLSLGLNVVSGKVEGVLKSPFNHLINYYDSESPESIAKAIKQMKFYKPEQIHLKILNLDEKFKISLEKILKDEK